MAIRSGDFLLVSVCVGNEQRLLLVEMCVDDQSQKLIKILPPWDRWVCLCVHSQWTDIMKKKCSINYCFKRHDNNIPSSTSSLFIKQEKNNTFNVLSSCSKVM